MRDEGVLQSALAHPINRWHYDAEADLPKLAAAYGTGIAKNHPFVDGNKRTAFQVMYVFVGLNGSRIVATEPEVVASMEGLAACDVDEGALAEWLRRCTQQR